MFTQYYLDLISNNIFNTSGMFTLPIEYQIGLSSTKPNVDGTGYTEPADTINSKGNVWTLEGQQSIMGGLGVVEDKDGKSCLTQPTSSQDWQEVKLINIETDYQYKIQCQIFNTNETYIVIKYTDGTETRTIKGSSNTWETIELISDYSKKIETIEWGWFELEVIESEPVEPVAEGETDPEVESEQPEIPLAEPKKSYVDIASVIVEKVLITPSGYKRIKIDNDSDTFLQNNETRLPYNKDKLYFPETILPWSGIKYYLIFDMDGNLLMFGEFKEILDIPIRTIVSIPIGMLKVDTINSKEG